MSCDHDLANEWVRCSGRNASYITKSIDLALTIKAPYACDQVDNMYFQLVKILENNATTLKCFGLQEDKRHIYIAASCPGQSCKKTWYKLWRW